MPHQSTHLKSFLSLASLATLALTSACGTSSSSSVASMVSNVSANSSVQNGDVWASVSANLNTNSYTLVAMSLPIVNPNNPTQDYGSVSLSPVLCTGSGTCVNSSALTLSINLTEVASLQSVSNQLPNDTAIPLSGVSSSSTVALAIGNTGGKVYVDFSSGVAVVGVAFPFAQLNGVGTYVAGLDLFDAVTYTNVTAYVGIFAGAGNEQTGIALFVDLSKVINGTSTAAASSNAVALEALAASTKAVFSNSVSSKVALKPTSHSLAQEYELLYQMEKLGESHPKLSLSNL